MDISLFFFWHFWSQSVLLVQLGTGGGEGSNGALKLGVPVRVFTFLSFFFFKKFF